MTVQSPWLDPDVNEQLWERTLQSAPAEAPRRPQLAERLLTRADLGSLPQPEPLIADTIDKRTQAVLSGRRGRGKSLLALDWSLSLATGKPWQGRPVESCRVLWVAAEGAFGMHRRVAAWEYAWKRQVDNDRLLVLPLPVNLYTGQLVDELVAVVAEHRVGFVVIDTWARNTVGGKENDNSDATQACARMEPLRDLGATALVIAHTDADDTKTRGATAIEDNADLVYRLKGDPTHLVLTRTKRKDGPEYDELHLKLQTVAFGTGEHDNSAVIASTTPADIGDDLSARATDLLSVFMSAFFTTGATKAELRNAAGMAPASFHRAINALLNSGALVNTGTDKRPHYKLGATGDTP